MKEVLLIIAGMSLCGSASYLCYLVIKACAKSRLTSGWRYNFLKVAALLFVLPISLAVVPALPQNLETYSEPAAKSTIPDNFDSVPNGTSVDTELFEDLPFVTIQVPVAPQKPAAEPEAPFNTDLAFWLIFGTWAVGAAAVFSVKTAGLARFKSAVKRSQLPVTCDERKLLEECKRMLGTKQTVQLTRSAAVGTPMFVGVLRPSVILPEKPISDKSLKYVYLHELTHLMRADILSKALGTLAVALHWFNPLVWAFWREYAEQLELSCDERAVRDIEQECRREYGLAILEAVPVRRVQNVGLVFGTSGKKKLKRRIDNMLGFKKMKKSHIIVAAAVAAAVVTSTCIAAAFVMPDLKPSIESKREKLLNMSVGECEEFLQEHGFELDKTPDAKWLVGCCARDPDSEPWMGISAPNSALALLETMRSVREYLGLDVEPTISAEELASFPGEDAVWGDKYLFYRTIYTAEPSYELPQTVADEISRIIGNAEAVRYRLENPSVSYTGAEDGGGSYVTFTADWVRIREPENDPYIIGMKEALYGLTDPDDIDFAEEIIDGWIGEMKSWPERERLETYLVMRENDGEVTFYYRYVMDGTETLIELNEYAAEYMTEDYDERLATGADTLRNAVAVRPKYRFTSALFSTVDENGVQVQAQLDDETVMQFIDELLTLDFANNKLELSDGDDFKASPLFDTDEILIIHSRPKNSAIGFHNPYIAVAESAEALKGGQSDWYKFSEDTKVFEMASAIAEQIRKSGNQDQL